MSGIDAALAALAARYRSRLPARLEALEAAVEAALADDASEAEWFEATNLAHRLRGSAATHGLAELGLAAAALETALEAAAQAAAPAPTDGLHAARGAVRDALAGLLVLRDSP